MGHINVNLSIFAGLLSQLEDGPCWMRDVLPCCHAEIWVLEQTCHYKFCLAGLIMFVSVFVFSLSSFVSALVVVMVMAMTRGLNRDLRHNRSF